MTSVPEVPVMVSLPLVPIRVQPRALLTVVVTVTVLLVAAGSDWVAVTVARWVRVPVARGSATTVTTTCAPAARLPRVQVTAVVQVPWVVVAEMTVRAGPVKVSVRETPVAVAGPLLVTVTV